VTSNVGIPTLAVLNTIHPTATATASNVVESTGDLSANDDNEGTSRVIVPDGTTIVTLVYEEANTNADNHPARGAGFFGNLSVCKAMVPPVPPEVDLIDATDVNKTTPTTVLTNDATPTIEGVCTAGDTVTVQIDGTDITPTTVCTDTGTFTITPDTDITNGEHEVTATQTDPNTGVTSSPSPVDNLVVDTIAPTPHTLDSVDGNENDTVLTTNNTPVINGTCETGTTVTVYIDGSAITPTQECVEGKYSITPDTAIADGKHNVTTTDVDAAGNIANAGPVALTINTALPDYEVALTLDSTTFINDASAFFATIRITELLGGINSGDVVYTINKNSLMTLNFDNTLMVNADGRTLDNANWVWEETDYLYKLRYVGQSGIFNPSVRVYVGLAGVFTPPSAAKGKFIFKVKLRSGSGDTVIENNEDSDAISYSNVN